MTAAQGSTPVQNPTPPPWTFAPKVLSRGTHQPSALAAQTGVLEPCSHVFVRADNQGSNHEYSLPILDDSLAALGKQDTGAFVTSRYPAACLTGKSMGSWVANPSINNYL